MACLAQCLGPERMRKLIRCAEAIERVQDQPGLVAAVKVRLSGVIRRFPSFIFLAHYLDSTSQSAPDLSV